MAVLSQMSCQITKPSTCLHTVRDLVQVQFYFPYFSTLLCLALKYGGNITLSFTSTGLHIVILKRDCYYIVVMTIFCCV